MLELRPGKFSNETRDLIKLEDQESKTRPTRKMKVLGIDILQARACVPRVKAFPRGGPWAMLAHWRAA
ncbi:hypothetical protein WG66_005999 [Moniliophthora roreri]|nr:hypothetical protein WG66_005999 [Moniliophthora roreri]